MTTERVLTTEQAAEAFWVSSRTIETWAARRLIAPVSPGRYRESDLAEVELSTRRRPRLVRLLTAAAM